MAEHRFFQRVSDQSEQCDCDLCLRHDRLMIEMEAAVAAPVDLLLEARWLPIEIVALVKTGSPAASKASMLVRIHILRRATDWFASPEYGRHLVQSYELAKRTGLRPGEPQQGWFEQWLWRAGGGIGKAQRYIRHEVSATTPVLDLLGVVGNTRQGWRAVWPGPRVVGSRGMTIPLDRFVPDPGNFRWTEES